MIKNRLISRRPYVWTRQYSRDQFRRINKIQTARAWLPNAGGILTLLRGGFDSPEVTKEYEDLYRQLVAIRDLKLIVFDPLQAFIGADANKDPAAGQYFCTLLGKGRVDKGGVPTITQQITAFLNRTSYYPKSKRNCSPS